MESVQSTINGSLSIFNAGKILFPADFRGKGSQGAMPTGAFALHKLELTTQVPTRLVYLTDGHPRKFQIGKATVEFKATTPGKVYDYLTRLLKAAGLF